MQKFNLMFPISTLYVFDVSSLASFYLTTLIIHVNAKTGTSKTYDVVVLVFYVPLTAKVILRQDLNFKSYPKEWSSPESNL